jgi:hypothetical protein
MARGFESKSVTSQQEDDESLAAPSRPQADGALQARRRRLELSKADVERRLAEARAEPHRVMLRRALSALDDEIASLR